MWNLEYDTNELIYKAEIENRLVVAKGEGDGRKMDWEFGIKMQTIIYRMDKQQGLTV